MASMKLPNNKYTSSLPPEDLDLENDSEGFPRQTAKLQKDQSDINKHRNSNQQLTWFRWGSVVAIQGVILLLLFWREKEGV